MNNYTKIINYNYDYNSLPNRQSKEKRASQFMPFSALQGHQEAIHETSRITVKRKILNNDILEQLNQNLKLSLERNLRVIITYFVKDATKKGGSYHTTTAKIIKYNEVNKEILLDNRLVLKLDNISNLEFA